MKEVLIPLNIKNRNGRIYTREELEPHVNSLNTLYGELGHGISTIINVMDSSHTISNLNFINSNLVGDIQISNSIKGKQLQSLIDSGIKFVFRPRSIGLVDINGYVKLDKLISFDAIVLSDDAWYDLKQIRKLKLEKLNQLNNE